MSESNFIVDSGLEASGRIAWQYEGNGVVIPGESRHNTITYPAADAMARMVGGDTTYRPAFIGFLFGNNGSPPFPAEFDRLQDWSAIGTELAGIHANVFIAPIATVSYKTDKSRNTQANYVSNVVSITSSTALIGSYAFLGASYKTELEVGDSFYNVILLSRRQDTAGRYLYLPFARASLKKSDGTYPPNLDGMSFGITWNVTFY
jgi:hypothetical protein